MLRERCCQHGVSMTRRADRLLPLLELLRSRPVNTSSALANSLGVSVRTLYRDIEALAFAGVPVRGEAGVGYVLQPGYYLPPLNLTAEEAETLALGARLLSAWSDGPVATIAAAALAKIRVVLPAASQRGIDQEFFWAPLWVRRQAPAVVLALGRAAFGRATYSHSRPQAGALDRPVRGILTRSLLSLISRTLSARTRLLPRDSSSCRQRPHARSRPWTAPCAHLPLRPRRLA